MSTKVEILTARNAILASAAVLVLSVVGTCLSMLRPPDSGGIARDSYGVRDDGFRALTELLEEVGIEVSRSVSPPEPRQGSRGTLVMIDPNPQLVDVAPKYLHALQEWIKGGGRLVITPSRSRSAFSQSGRVPKDEADVEGIFEALDINSIVSLGDPSEAFIEEDFSDPNSPLNAASGTEDINDEKSQLSKSWDEWMKGRAPSRDVTATLEGSLASIEGIHRLAVPGESFQTLNGKDSQLRGAVRCPDKEGNLHLLVAVIKRGAGEIVVVSEPAMLSNRLIAKADNSVLSVNLIAPAGEPVTFDEFYHGLAVRGNPLFLLTRLGFAMVTLCLLLLIGLWTWRSAVFLGSPLADIEPSRRDIREYVSAMAEFFSRGRGSRTLIVHEVRDGVLREICNELRLPIDTLDTDKITTLLARRDRSRAERLRGIVREVDAHLAESGEYSRSEFLPHLQRLANCL